MDHKQFTESVVKQASSIMKETGSHAPMIMAFGDSAAVIGLDFSSEEAKTASVAIARAELAKMHASFYAMVSEAWMVTVDRGDAKTVAEAEKKLRGVKASTHPDKVEILMIAVVGYDKVVLVRIPVIRKGKKVELGTPEYIEPQDKQYAGRMMEMLPPLN